MWFCYEKSSMGVWQPCVHHQQKPSGEITKFVRSTIHSVPKDCIDVDGSPNFGKLQKLFPPPPPPPEIIKDEG